MGGLKRRVEQLESRADASRKDEVAALSQEVLQRMTDEELRGYEEALRRARDSGGVFAEEDRPIL